jgi:hypothetical protein
VHLLKDGPTNKFYVQIGRGGELYFDEIDHAIKDMDLVVKRRKRATLRKYNKLGIV